MNISAPFIRRPIATRCSRWPSCWPACAAYTQLPVAPLPRVDFPTIQVSANLPGASPETMASAVATPLERRFGRIAGVTEMTSTSTLGRRRSPCSSISIATSTAAARDVQAAINAAGGELPDEPAHAAPTTARSTRPTRPILILSLTSETPAAGQVFDTANTVLAQKIVAGGGRRAGVRGRRAAARRARAGRSGGARRHWGWRWRTCAPRSPRATVNSPKGGHRRPTQRASHRRQRPALRRRGLSHADRRLPATARAVRLGDVATRHRRRREQPRRPPGSNGERAVLLIIRRQPGANIIETIERVKALLPALVRLDLARPSTSSMALDRAQTIRASVARRGDHACSSASCWWCWWSSSSCAARGPPPSPASPCRSRCSGTFGVMYLLGYSLDNLSLMALTISTGFVVDDAIVVTENITRYIEQGDTPLEAALQGRAADRLHHRLHHRLAARRVHPHPADGRRRRPALPRVRRHAQHRHRRLGGGVARR